MEFPVCTTLCILGWRSLFSIGYNLYGYKINSKHIWFMSLVLGIVSTFTLDGYTVKVLSPFINCSTSFVVIYISRRRVRDAVQISAVTCGLGFLIQGLTFHYGDPGSRITEESVIILILSVLGSVMLRYKIHFTFSASPRIMASHGHSLTILCVTFLIFLSSSGYVSLLLPKDLSFYLITAAIIVEMIMLLEKSYRLETQ